VAREGRRAMGEVDFPVRQAQAAQGTLPLCRSLSLLPLISCAICRAFLYRHPN
jgi:hypothetical protein